MIPSFKVYFGRRVISANNIKDFISRFIPVTHLGNNPRDDAAVWKGDVHCFLKITLFYEYFFAHKGYNRAIKPACGIIPRRAVKRLILRETRFNNAQRRRKDCE